MKCGGQQAAQCLKAKADSLKLKVSESVGSKHRLVVSEQLWTPWLEPTRAPSWLLGHSCRSLVLVKLWDNVPEKSVKQPCVCVCLCPSPCTWRGTGCSHFNRTACNENIKTLIQIQHCASSPERVSYDRHCVIVGSLTSLIPCFLKVQRLDDWLVVWETVNFIKAAAKWNAVCRSAWPGGGSLLCL